MRLTTLLIFLPLVCAFTSAQKTQAPIKVHLKGLKKNKGDLLVALFSRETGFPEDGKKAFKTWKLKPHEWLHLDNIPEGTYALAILHDLDNNAKMSYNLVGYPKDGYSTSPDGGPRFTKASFQQSKFVHSGAGTELTMEIHY